MVRKLGVLPQVLQHLRPQLAVLLPHVSGIALLISFATAVTLARLPGRLSRLPVRDGKKKGTGSQRQLKPRGWRPPATEGKRNAAGQRMPPATWKYEVSVRLDTDGRQPQAEMFFSSFTANY